MSIAGIMLIHQDETKTVGRAVDSFAQVCDPILGLAVDRLDGAVELARDKGVEIHKANTEWTTHGPGIEQLLRLARERGDYALNIGATETMQLVEPLPELDAPLYLLPTIHSGTHYHTERLFKSGIEWTMPGPVHSTPQPFFFDERRQLPNIIITTHDDDGRRPEKLRRYRDELEAWVQDHPHDHRSVYYLAQTYWHLGQVAAASGVYQRRAKMSDGDVEQWHSIYMAGVCEMQFNFENGAVMLLDAFRRRPERMEPLYTLEQACHELRKREPAPTEGEWLWMEPEAYLGER